MSDTSLMKHAMTFTSRRHCSEKAAEKLSKIDRAIKRQSSKSILFKKS